ncbi:hypothetical protein [Streptomyces sp. NPDC058394]|uniref:hypothetical protein n=1 Tax=Streptomyces sp. NPDC058394 TaxID=3346477 RepID=UPI00366483C7
MRVDSSPGVDLLLSIGAWRPEFLLTGQTLRDQGLMVTGLLEAGWPREHLRQVIAGRALPDPLRLTVGAVIASRLRAAAAMPVPSPAAGGATVPHQGTAPESPWEDRSPTPTPPTWAERQEQDTLLWQGADAQRGCDGDDGLCPALAVVGETMCAACLGWPTCPGCTRRTHDGSLCSTCVEQAAVVGAAAIEADPTPDGTCPGHDGTPCGRAVVALGLCVRCRVAAQADRDRAEREWRAALDQAVATAEADEATEPTPAPF